MSEQGKLSMAAVSADTATQKIDQAKDQKATTQSKAPFKSASSGIDEAIAVVMDGGGVYAQTISPNPQIQCRPGYCLVYVREAFGIAAKYPTAQQGWEASSTKHQDANYPQNAWVPIWFALSDNPAGHVALRQPDGSVWSASHPTSTTPVHHDSLDEILAYYNGRLTYLGWTEDIEDVTVVS